MRDDLISRQTLYEKTAEWEAQALHMVEKTMNDEDLTEWKKWSAVLKERSAFKFDVEDAPSAEPLTEEDYIELRDRFGEYVEFVVKDMISGKGERWIKTT